MAGGLEPVRHFPEGETFARAGAAPKQGDEIPAFEDLLHRHRLLAREGGRRLVVLTERTLLPTAITSGHHDPEFTAQHLFGGELARAVLTDVTPILDGLPQRSQDEILPATARKCHRHPLVIVDHGAPFKEV